MKLFFLRHRYIFFALISLLAVFLLNSFHEEYPDEYDSILGGKYINELRVPYRDWFQHHQPGAYVLAALILPFSGISFVNFRIILAIVFFTINVGGYYLVRSRLKTDYHRFYLYLIFVIALGATFFWGQMLLADTLAAYLFLPAFALVSIKSYYDEKIEPKDLFIISFFGFLTWFTSLTYMIIVALLTVYAVYLYIRSNQITLKIRPLIRTLVTTVTVPYILFFAFFLITGSIGDYYFANITYNQNYYIYNYPRPPGAPVNPVRYSVVLAHDFINSYVPTLTSLQFFPLTDPLKFTLALSGFSLGMLFILKRKYALAVFLALIVIYGSARSNPSSIRETDYQSSMYIILSLFAGLFTLSEARRILDQKRSVPSKVIIIGVIFILNGIFITSSVLDFGVKFTSKFYPKYMGTMPLIYDRPEIAQYVNLMISDSDYVYIGPFEFKELFFLKSGKSASKYHWFLNHAAKSRIKDELIADLSLNRPKVIVFKRNYAPWGGNPAEFNYFMTEFLDKNYFRLFVINAATPDFEYKWKFANTRNFDIDGDFNLDIRHKDEILKELIAKDLIEAVPKKTPVLSEPGGNKHG